MKVISCSLKEGFKNSASRQDRRSRYQISGQAKELLQAPKVSKVTKMMLVQVMRQ
jgi:hypothetical protein